MRHTMTAAEVDAAIARAPRTTEQMLANRRRHLDRTAQAEALDPALRPLLAGLQVGQGLPVLVAWSKGWTAANLAAPIPG